MKQLLMALMIFTFVMNANTAFAKGKESAADLKKMLEHISALSKQVDKYKDAKDSFSNSVEFDKTKFLSELESLKIKTQVRLAELQSEKKDKKDQIKAVQTAIDKTGAYKRKDVAALKKSLKELMAAYKTEDKIKNKRLPASSKKTEKLPVKKLPAKKSEKIPDPKAEEKPAEEAK